MTKNTPSHSTDAAAFEKEKWDIYFKEALNGEGQEHEKSLWWNISDRDSLEVVRELFPAGRPISVLEAGCGSAGTSLLLAKHFPVSRLSLVDVSENALLFARHLTEPELRPRVEYIHSDIVAMPFPDGLFDLVWNVGVIEHYSPEMIGHIVKEMLRVTRPGGVVVAAIPNRNSIAVLKAWLLGTRFGQTVLKLVPGYRFDTEILYGNVELMKLLHKATGHSCELTFGGNLLWVGAPERLVALSDRFLKRSRFSFLSFLIIVRIDR